MSTYVWVKFVSGNLLPDGYKMLPEPMLTNHKVGFVAFASEKFHKVSPNLYHLYEFEITD